MKIRVTGSETERKKIVADLTELGYHICSVSKEYDCDDIRFKSVYIDILSDDRKIVGNLQDFQIIEYCNNFRSKSDVMRQFNISFDEAQEILDRLAGSGDLLKWVEDKRYVYLDSRWKRFVKAECGNCEHRGGFGDCLRCDDPLDSAHYKKVHEKCKIGEFEPARHAFWDLITEENYRKLQEGSE